MRSLSGWALGLALAGGVLAGLGPSALASTAGHYAVPVLRLPFMAAPPFDGMVRPSQWREADEMTGLGSGPDLAPWTAHFWVGADRRELFIAMVSETPPGGKLLARVNPMPRGINAHPAMVDDTVEIAVAPSPHRAGGRIYRAILNARGAIWQEAFRNSGGRALRWRGHWRIVNRIVGNRWHFEAAIPWRDFGIRNVQGRTIGIRVGRDWLQVPGRRWARARWSPLRGSYLDPRTMPRVTFVPGAPVVQVQRLRNKAGRSADIRLTIRNPADTPQRVRYSIVVRPPSSTRTTESRTLTLPPRYTRIVEVRPSATPDERLYTQIRVSSPDGRTIFYRRDFQWTPARPRRLWALEGDTNQRIDTAFMYYPSLNAMQVRVNLKGLVDPGAVRAVALHVRDQKTGKVVAGTVLPAAHHYVTRLREWRLPPLNGKYDLLVRLQGTHAKAQVLPFVRYRFAWEHNRLGRANLIVPPFTPIRVRGDTVSTVLRRYTMNGLGLWRQVDALGRDLLEAPMRIEVRAAGKTFIARGRMKFTRITPTQVIAVAHWAAGPLHGSTRSVWDYDGMMKTTLTLEPTRKMLDWVGLVVPLVDKRMPLMHAVTDGLRFNYAGKTPAGLGEVWNGKDARRNDLIGSYVPYLWVGGPERGVAVFGDNDRGWVDYQAKRPCQELVRKADGTLEMRLNLVAEPARLTKPHRIVLGFQATPIKPMPKNWRLWTLNLTVPGAYDMLYVGSGLSWGALTGSGDLYPRGHDLSIYDEFAKTRRTGVIPSEFIKRWLAGYKVPNPKFATRYGAGIKASFQHLSLHPAAVVVYTNPAAMRVDTRAGRTYLNEWGEHLYPTRRYSYGEYLDGYVDPHKSFRDFALWYYDKMLTTFANGIYWDNMYLGDDFNTVLSDAYRLPDGRIQPAMALWSKRALVRRTAVLDRQLGMPDMNMIHMTNAAIAPILSFARIDLDWEMRASDKPFQERFSRAFILTESTGRQFGNVPGVLENMRGHHPKKIAWARHTYDGVCLTFELCHFGGGAELRRDFEWMVRFGYGTPRTRVWNYWQHDYPMQVTGDETSSIIVAKPGQAIIVVCDWGHGGTLRLKPDRRVLNLPGRLTVIDLETQRPVKVTAGGDIVFHLKRYDYRMFLVTAQGHVRRSQDSPQ